MAKYLLEVSYSAEGLRGLQKEGGSSRREAAARAISSIGGHLESMYYAFGDHDAIAIFEAPDNVNASALAIGVSASGLLRTKVTPLLTIEEVDAAVKKSLVYRPPGQ
jgi:uncharacterized protein with GYD domain